MSDSVEQVVAAHRRAGQAFRAAGCDSFVIEAGTGEPVVLVHGLPSSSFMYRKVVAELAGRGFRALAFDLPGLGLAERPVDYDYSIDGLARFTAAAVDELGLGRFHLVVHDAGGPIGLTMAAGMPERIASVTVTNTIFDVAGSRFPGEVVARFTRRVPRWLASPWVWQQMMDRACIGDRRGISDAEVDAYRVLAVGDDGGAGYLAIMSRVHDRGSTPSTFAAAVDTTSVPYPVQILWGADDPVLRLSRFGWAALRATGLDTLEALPAKHFLHEDQAPVVADRVARLARGALPHE